MKCQYALSPNKEIVYIDEVENGLKCNCTCISCGERLLAKNGGSYREHHFSHESGHDCGGNKETILHIYDVWQPLFENRPLAADDLSETLIPEGTPMPFVTRQRLPQLLSSSYNEIKTSLPPTAT